MFCLCSAYVLLMFRLCIGYVSVMFRKDNGKIRELFGGGKGVVGNRQIVDSYLIDIKQLLYENHI